MNSTALIEKGRSYPIAGCAAELRLDQTSAFPASRAVDSSVPVWQQPGNSLEGEPCGDRPGLCNRRTRAAYAGGRGKGGLLKNRTCILVNDISWGDSCCCSACWESCSPVIRVFSMPNQVQTWKCRPRSAISRPCWTIRMCSAWYRRLARPRRTIIFLPTPIGRRSIRGKRNAYIWAADIFEGQGGQQDWKYALSAGVLWPMWCWMV